MSKILVLADDLTGANDTGAAIRKMGWDTCSVVSHEAPLPQRDYSCLCVNLDSRGEAPGTAYARVRQCAGKFRTKDIGVFSKRIDSTLRGNLGAESDAMLDELFPEGAALVAPAFPQAGRAYYDDCVYVHGIELTKTAAARDPKCPVRTNSALSLFREQSKRRSALIGLAAVRSGTEILLEAVRAQLSGAPSVGRRGRDFCHRGAEPAQRRAWTVRHGRSG